MVHFSFLSSLVAGSLLASSAAAAALGNTNIARHAVDCTGTNALSVHCKSSEVPYRRDFYYVGGRPAAGAAPGTTITVDQLYVEKLTPTCPKHKANPLVFFHGGGIAGSTWLNTPDGREGWASYFVKKGYVVYLVDNNAIGRSAHNNITGFTMSPGSATQMVQKYFTNPQAYMGYPQARFHTQWPGTGATGDAIYDQFHQSFIPLTTNFVAQETALRKSGCELLSLLGEKAFLVSHSLGGRNPILLANDCPQYIAGHVALESATQPFMSYGDGLAVYKGATYGLTMTPVDYEPAISSAADLKYHAVGNDTIAHRNCYLQQEPARKLPKINSVPLLQLTSEASVHATYDHCLIQFLKQAGGEPEWIQLADIGIHGNGHFMHVEKNNLQIAAVVLDWIKHKVSNMA